MLQLFLDRLPEGRQSSDAANREAQAFGLQVPEGAIFVRPHWRGLHGLPPKEAVREFYSRGGVAVAAGVVTL